ncbi:MAG: helix-turn-helix transcriptional regulator [Boseongicola sp.]
MFSPRFDQDRDNSDGLGRDLKILDGIASWCGALHGSMSLDLALEAVSRAIGATAAALSRDARSSGKIKLVAEFDTAAGDRTINALRAAYAPEVLTKYYNKMRGGSVWYLSEHQDDSDFEMSRGLASWRLSRGIVEVVVVALESTGLQHDYLEFHFTRELQRAEREDLERVFPILVRAWYGRRTGLVTQAQMDERIQRARELAEENRISPDEPLLGYSNPARLSRAEFRVCLLLSRGLLVKAVTEELGLSEATVRSHLRSIYSKSDTTGLPDLLYRLLSSSSAELPAGYGRN